jgi:hypothetical protein
MFIRSPHCLSVARTLNKLSELGPRGFQPIAMLFSAPGSHASGRLVNHMIDSFKLGYRWVTRLTPRDSYVARGKDDVLNVPPKVVIVESIAGSNTVH